VNLKDVIELWWIFDEHHYLARQILVFSHEAHHRGIPDVVVYTWDVCHSLYMGCRRNQ